MRLRVRALWPNVKIPKNDRLAIIAAIRKEFMTDILLDLRSTVATWDDRPTFGVKNFHNILTRWEVGLGVDVNDQRWLEIERGFLFTVKLSEDFRPKTNPGTFISGQGYGMVVEGANDPPREAVPRDWYNMLNEQYQPQMASFGAFLVTQVMRDSGLHDWVFDWEGSA